MHNTTKIKEEIILLLVNYKMPKKLKKALENLHDEIESDIETSFYIYKKNNERTNNEKNI